MLGQGHAGAALGLFCWGAFELFLVDKFIRPKLIGRRVELPFLAVLFGLLGGVSTMGVIGLFVGPFMMAVLFWWLRGGRVDAVVASGKSAAGGVRGDRAGGFRGDDEGPRPRPRQARRRSDADDGQVRHRGAEEGV